MIKLYTCEEGGAHLRISFWHLLVNFEKPEKSEFWKMKKKKKCWRYHFKHVHRKPQSYEVYGSWDIEWDKIFLSFWTIFCSPPLSAPHLPTQKIKISKKWKKHLGMSSFHTCTPKKQSYHVCLLWYGVQQTYFFVILGHFLLFFPTIDPKN